MPVACCDCTPCANQNEANQTSKAACILWHAFIGPLSVIRYPAAYTNPYN